MATTTRLDASELGALFVKQYYSILEKRPDEMHKFYVSNARFSFKNSSKADSTMNCSGSMSIQDGLKSVGITSVSTSDIAASSLQCNDDSSPNEIMVMVTGSLNMKKEEEPKLFAHSFFISETMDGVMFIVAESLHILSSATQKPEKEKEVLSEAKAAEKVQPETAQTQSVKETSAEKEQPVAQTQKPPVAPEVSQEPVATPVPVQETQAKPQSQASQKEKAPAQAWGPNSKNASYMSALAPASQSTPATQKPTESEDKAALAQSEPTSKKSSASNTNHSQKLSKEQVERSIYLKDLSPETTKEEIQEVFSKFGKISLVDLRQEKKCAYVEYDDPSSAKAALVKPATPFVIGGKQIEVKERLMVQPGDGHNGNNSKGRGGAKPKQSSTEGSGNANSGNSKNSAKSGGKPKENGATKSEDKKVVSNSGEDKQKSATAPASVAASSSNSKPSSDKPKAQPKQNQPKPAAKTKNT